MTNWQCRECRAQVAPGAPRCPHCPSTSFEKPEAGMTLKIARDGSVSDSAAVAEPRAASPAIGVSVRPEAVAEDAGIADTETAIEAEQPAVPEPAPEPAPEPEPEPAVPPRRTPPRTPPRSGG